MARLSLSQEIACPAPEVFRFVATDHVTNHPRWDPAMSLEQLDPGPIGVGTRIHRSYDRGGGPVEGEMEVIEFEPDRTMAVVIRDGPLELDSRLEVEPVGEDASRLTFLIDGDVPLDAMEEPVRGSLTRIRELIEAER